jgi:N-glycosylase/DNA lyase
MVRALSEHFGELMGTVDSVDYYAFPRVDKLCEQGVEIKLRTLGFGYRAKYIVGTARLLMERHTDHEGVVAWLISLRERPYEEVHAALLDFPGVGPKVADCVCLMSLDQHEAIPVDTHVWQIAQRNYGFKGKGGTKTLSKQLYQAVGDHFRTLYQPYSGWAHSVLFAADLSSLQTPKKRKRKAEE